MPAWELDRARWLARCMAHKSHATFHVFTSRDCQSQIQNSAKTIFQNNSHSQFTNSLHIQSIPSWSLWLNLKINQNALTSASASVIGTFAVSLGSNNVLNKPLARSNAARTRREFAASKIPMYCADTFSDKIEANRITVMATLNAVARICVGKTSRVHIWADSQAKQRQAELNVPQATASVGLKTYQYRPFKLGQCQNLAKIHQ